MDVEDREKQNRPSVSRNGLQTLCEALGLDGQLSGSAARSDSVLVAIDFENTGNIRDGFLSSTDSQVGLAVLDARDLGRDIKPGRVIATRNFVTGSPSYIKRASARFSFGKSIAIKTAAMLKRIKSVIPRDRHVILVGHSVRNELEMLRILGYDFVSSSMTVIDTVRVANEVFGFWGGSLGELLVRLGCPFSHLHSGGNDASFTLRASLLLACKKCEGIIDQATVNTLEQIAIGSIPYRLDPEVKAARKKEKKQAKRRRSVEEQDQIRAERAARRAELGQSQLF
ncbi:hypothetical protein PG985_010634 [Apiospora marii]|uniref:Gfd2/YDR514C-like C-terminal domain-containing protein n=1 Tax=Apiospora marii TaxID=335849 RepID=A0ABR1T1J1_9PEZI